MRWTPALFLAFALPLAAEEPTTVVDDFFTRWDANKDGIVSKDECESSRLFGKIDKDTDGQITRAEVEADWKAEQGTESLTEPKTGATPEAAGGRKNGFPSAGKSDRRDTGLTDDMNRMRVRRIFNKYDRNGDDALTPDEAASYWFDVVDLDRDGALMKFELAGNPKVGPEKAEMAMQYYDKDGDGSILSSEWSLPEDGTFSKMDMNGDAKISFDEALVGMTPPTPPGGGTSAQAPGRGMNVDQVLKDMDSDGDGKVAQAEFKGPEQLFARGDANGDGYLDRTELESAAKKLGGNPAAGGKDGKKEMAGLIKRADKDGDGKVTREEWPGKPQGFDRLDKNGDGVLDGTDFGEAAPAGDGGMKESEDGGSMEGEGSSPKAAAPGSGGKST